MTARKTKHRPTHGRPRHHLPSLPQGIDRVSGESPAADREFLAEGTAYRLDTPGSALRLVEFLRSPSRRLPVVAISIHPNYREPFIDPDSVARDLHGAAVTVVLSAACTYELTDGLGDRQRSVFYGAGRVYPVGVAWMDSPRLAPLRMCDAGRGPAVRTRLVDDALQAAHAAGQLAQGGSLLPGSEEAVASVDKPFNDHQVLVRANGRQAVLRVADLVVGVRMDRLLRKGQQVRGQLVGQGPLARFVPHPVADDAAARVQRLVPSGGVALARVDELGQQTARLLLHPQVAGQLQADADDDLRDWLSLGDVVPVEVLWFDGELHLALASLSDGCAAIPVLPDGPSWLLPSDTEPGAGEEPSANTAPAPSPIPVAPDEAEAALRTELALARDQVAELAEELTRLQQEKEHWRRTAKNAQSQVRRGRSPNQPTAVFGDPEQQLRHEIWLAYLQRINEPQRTSMPLPDAYDFGPGFVGSLSALQGVSRAKVVSVLLEVLLGLDKQLKGRELHAWRVARTGEQERRANGATAWRVSLQVGTPGARRLKYWQHPGGRIEFDMVGHHDDGLN